MGKKKSSHILLGAYIGMILAVFLLVFIAIMNSFFTNINISFLNNLLDFILKPIILILPNIKTGIIPVFYLGIIGFLIGWGIHSLIRRLKK